MFEGQNNFLTRHTCLNQLVSNPILCAVMLNPDFAIPNIQMQDTTMNPVITTPTGMDQFIMIPLLIYHYFDIYIPMRWFVPGIFLND